MPEVNGNGHAESSDDALRVATIAELRALQSTALLDRVRWAKQAGLSFNDARDLYEVFGYDRVISAKKYRERYNRGGIAGRVVDVLPDAAWAGTLEIVEDEDPDTNTALEQAWRDLDQRLNVQAKLYRTDKLSKLSTYAVMLIGAPGELDQELPRGTDQRELLYFTPFFAGGGPGSSARNKSTLEATDADATIFEYDVDPKSVHFGLPLSYTIKRTDIQNPALAKPVHWSRILHVAADLLDDDVFGQPALERVWNLLDDLDKVTGGGAEAFFLRANQGMHLDIDKDMELPDAQNAIASLKEQSELYKHQMTRWIRTRGVEVKPLGSDVANFDSPADAIITQIAGAKAIPKRILVGSEMGELASSQDRDNWKDQVNRYQTSYAGRFIVRALVDRLIAYGYLPTPAKPYEVRWPQIETLTEKDKAEGAKSWAGTNQAQGTTVFTDDEIRDKWYSMAPLTLEQKQQAIDDKLAAAPPAPESVAGPDSALRAALGDDLEPTLRLLEVAIEDDDLEAIGELLALGDSPGHESSRVRLDIKAKV